jgi:hypothetical protein
MQKSSQHSKISEEFVKARIIQWLSFNGWKNIESRDLHHHGVDIKAKNINYSRYFFIETKGQGKMKQADENNFISSLGQILTRMKTDKSTRNNYAIGLPEAGARIALRRLPWQIAKKLVLYIFSVDHKGIVTQYDWKDLKKTQTKI